jgi:3-deoxy-manno-octulosonate cytidylyltransferase (CMP-KDO synthetase)
MSLARRARIGPVFVLAGDKETEDCGRAEAQVGAAGAAPEPPVLRVEGAYRNGSERIAAALRDGLLGRPMPALLLNLQADALGATPELLRAALHALRRAPDAGLGTVAVRVPAADPAAHGRTVVLRKGSKALDFSRTPLLGGDEPPDVLLLHVGVYAYRAESLLRVATLPPGPREAAESLEQLRWLEHGLPVALAVVDGPARLAWAVDRPEDLSGYGPGCLDAGI